MGSRKNSAVSRRKFLTGAAAASAAAIGGRGIYSVLDDFAGPARAYAASAYPYRQEQYLIDGLFFLSDNNVTVVIPPIYNDVFTATLNPSKNWTTSFLKSSQQRLENALNYVQGNRPATADGLTMVVAWGLPFFNTYVPGPWAKKAPLDTVAAPLPGVKPPRNYPPALLDAIKFPSDPPIGPGGLTIEQNHVAFKLRSDHSDLLTTVENQLFFDVGGPAYVGDLFHLTSKRVGFLGRGFGTTSAGKTVALKAGIPGADQIPEKSQLMMGFTSTQAMALGPDIIPSFETLPGVTDQFPNGYFAHGTAMHLSHLELDINAWYHSFSYADRVKRMMSPRTLVPPDGTVTMPNGPSDVAKMADVTADAQNLRLLGHNSALQMATRTGIDDFDNYGTYRPQGTSIPAREDFNTVDNPFAWMRDANDNWVQTNSYKAGLHFAVFVPGSARFHAARKAMDGDFTAKGGPNLRQSPYSLNDSQIGFNSIMRATHRQNFLVPPRAHRSFPLVELL